MMRTTEELRRLLERLYYTPREDDREGLIAELLPDLVRAAAAERLAEADVRSRATAAAWLAIRLSHRQLPEADFASAWQAMIEANAEHENALIAYRALTTEAGNAKE